MMWFQQLQSIVLYSNTSQVCGFGSTLVRVDFQLFEIEMMILNVYLSWPIDPGNGNIALPLMQRC